MKEVRVLINGLETNYKIAGSGPAILVLHGWGGSSDSWVKVQEILSEKGYQVIAPDFPGLGVSANPPIAWGVEEYADFVLRFAEKLELDKFFLLGHSFGGRIAINFSTLHPNKLKSLILIGSAGLQRSKSWSLRQRVVIKGLKFFHFLAELPILNIFYNSLRRAIYIFSGTRDYYSIKSPVMRETFKKVIEEDLFDCLPQIKNKTLVVWGEKDNLTPQSIAHLLKEKIADSELAIIPGVGHSPHLKSPEQLSEIILKFLNK